MVLWYWWVAAEEWVRPFISVMWWWPLEYACIALNEENHLNGFIIYIVGQLSSPLLTTEFIGEHPSDGKKYNSRIILCVVGSAEVQGWNFGGIFIRTPLTLNRINKCLPWPMLD